MCSLVLLDDSYCTYILYLEDDSYVTSGLWDYLSDSSREPFTFGHYVSDLIAYM